GMSIYHLRIKGIASHAGNHHDEGVSAVDELAHQILKLSSLTDYSTGTTVNVGKITGGTRSNVVADSAEAEIDVRFTRMEEARKIESIMRNLQPQLVGTSIEVTGGLNRPPMERTRATGQLFETAKSIANELGF